MDNTNADLERQIAELRARKDFEAGTISESVSPEADMVYTPMTLEIFDLNVHSRYDKEDAEEENLCAQCRKCTRCDSTAAIARSKPLGKRSLANTQMFLP
jgi:hypothetical protein